MRPVLLVKRKRYPSSKSRLFSHAMKGGRMWPFGRTIVLPSAREASVMSTLGVTGLEFAEAKAIRNQTKELRMRVARALDHMVKAGKAEAWVYTTDDAEPTGERFTR